MKSKKPYIVSALCVLIIACIFVFAFIGTGGEVKIVFPPLGKADCAVIYCEGSCVVIDCGNKGDGKGIADLCASLGAEKIDALFITHFDKDHLGGAAKLLTSIKVDYVYEPDYDDSEVDISEYSLYRLALDSACADGTVLVKLKEDVALRFGEVEYTVCAPHKDYEKSRDNNSSLVIMAETFGKKLLFAGDIEKQRIDDMLGEYDLECDLLKYPHHGDYHKSTGNFIKACSPAYAVITCDDRNALDESVALILKNAGASAYYTDTGKNMEFIITKNSVRYNGE